MNSTVKVTFQVVPPTFFTTAENYAALGHQLTFKNGELFEVGTELICEESLDRDEVIAKGADRLQPLLDLLEFGTAASLKLEKARTSRDDGGYISFTSTSYVSVTYNVSFPPVQWFSDLGSDRLRQVGWYVRGHRANWVVEKIRNLYEVLELECLITGKQYQPKKDFKSLRDAASHPAITLNKQTKLWLEDKLNCNYIDPANSQHIRFLEDQCQSLEDEAKKLILSFARWDSSLAW